MAKRIPITNLNARTVDIINTIRANASAEYQSLVPSVSQEKDIPKVGEVLFAYPALQLPRKILLRSIIIHFLNFVNNFSSE